jgi:hypothetical protein
MDKDGMYVVHDVVDDYPDLASTAIGDLEERHVVVYRVGHHPEGMRTHPLHPRAVLDLLHSLSPIRYTRIFAENFSVFGVAAVA